MEASIDRGTGIGHVLWSNRGRILGSTLALGLAAFLAGSLVPPVHRVSLRLTGEPAQTALWTQAAVADAAASALRIGDSPPTGVLAVWNDLIDRLAPTRPETGGDRLPDGSVVVWAEADDGGLARRRAEAMAKAIIGEAPSPAVQSQPPQPQPETQVTPAAPSPAKDPGDASIAALTASVAEARASLAAAETALARSQEAEPMSGNDAEGRRSTLDADRRAAAAAKQELNGIERFLRALPRAAPAQAPASVQATDEWAAWRDVRLRRDVVAQQVAELSRTLLDGHPRMATVRLRLSDLEQDLAEARERLGNALQRRASGLRREAARLDRSAADAMVALGASEAAAAGAAKAASEVDAARGTLAALEGALRAAEAARAEAPAPEPVAEPAPQPAPAAAETVAPAPQPAVSPPVVTEVSATEHRPAIWPFVTAAALFGLLGSSLVAAAGAARQPARGDAATAPVPRRPFVRPPAPANPPQRRSEGASASITAPDELIGGILASDISRLVVVSLGADDRPAAVEIVRRLALRGRQGALVDLSERQLAARGMGVPPDSLGVSDMIAGEATFAEIARADFATRAEAFGAGRATVDEAAFLVMERRNVLEFIERNYELLIVVCGDMDPDTVKALLTSDAALVLTVDGSEDERIAPGVQRLRDAGLTDMILVDGRQLAS